MRPAWRIVALAIGLGGLQGCTYSVHQVHTSDYSTLAPASRSREIGAEATQDVVLGVTNNTDFVEEAWGHLLAQCPAGQIVGISARHSTSHSFLSFTNTMHVRALCVE